jgi:hypothetical protein
MNNLTIASLVGTIIALSWHSSDGAAAQEIAVSLIGEWCQSTDPDLSGLCVAYFSGFLDGVSAGQVTTLDATQGQTCIPIEKLNSPEMHLYLRQFIPQHPDFWSQPARRFFAAALMNAFPCGQ